MTVLVFMATIAVACAATVEAASPPLRLHPDNPHYFLFRGKPTIIIGSGEHYGAVLNLDFDYVRYLETLSRDGLRHTRTFSGVYCEQYGAFSIARNTLAPAPHRYITPWARSDQAGYANGGNKFDLSRFDPAYFARLRDFMTQASRRGVVVEMNLYCPFYGDEMWRLSPMNAANNVNGVGRVTRTDVYTLDRNGGLLLYHEAVVRKIVAELNDFDNLYYEICNEPYFGGVTMDWQRRMVDVIVETERKLPRKHLISLNIANGSAEVQNLHPDVSILNFHYASPPNAVAVNYHLGRPIGDNETGFKGTGDTHYRMEAWEFILAGGALFSHLDYSFVAGHEDGTFQYPPTQPGGGNAAFRKQMRILNDFIHGFAFVRMRPDAATVRAVPKGVRARVLSEDGQQYAIYLFGKATGEMTLALPKGRYAVQWLDTINGSVAASQTLNHGGGEARLTLPAYAEDVALSIKRRR
ncbi:MAG: hypothetical protein GX446_17050 [Chthonomonadales bacterium]|nr:hypothetical protein [Chthonomonadales bacterium]